MRGRRGVCTPLDRDTGTSSVNTGFFERQPGTKPGTTCVQPETKRAEKELRVK